MRRAFHPNDTAPTAYLENYKEKLRNPKTGLLSPYLVKEFVPKLRA